MQIMTKETELLARARSRLSNLPYILACIVFSALPLLALAHDDMPSGNPSSCNEQRSHHPMRNNAFAPDPMGMSLFPPKLDLTDEQQEEIFELKHAQEPTVFEQERIARKTMQELELLIKSDHFDPAKAKSLAEVHGKALAELAYQHAVIHAKIWALLSEAQRKRLTDWPEVHPEPERNHFMD